MKSFYLKRGKLIILATIFFVIGTFLACSRRESVQEYIVSGTPEISEEEAEELITEEVETDELEIDKIKSDVLKTGPKTAATKIETEPSTTITKILHSVPFASQAPFGDWSDQRQQDGCEEASILMAIKWARGESLSKEEALKEILAASDYILEKYGKYRDTDLDDALTWIVRDYFAFEEAEVRKNISKADLITLLKEGHVIAAPMNGRTLKNPNFTPPGPINHMLLIRGYDPIKKVFITNDPGTRRGELYEYDEDLLFSALRAYPTGYHEPNNELRKDILIFWK